MKKRKLYVLDKDQVAYRPINSSSIVFLSIAVLTIGMIIGVGSVKPSVLNPEHSIFAFRSQKKEFSEKVFIDYMKEVGIRFPEVVHAQGIKECGFKSPRFKNHHNIFSLRKASNRPSTAIGHDEEGYCIYEDWQQSVLDYALYQTTYTRPIKTREQYLQYLKLSYAEDTNYVSSLIQIIKQKYGH